MNQLVPASQAGRGVQRAAPAAADVESRRLVDDTWDGAVLGLADVGLTLDTTNAVASAVTSEQGVRRRANGTYFRLRHGWVAYPTSIIVIRFEQELRRWPDGKLHTVGDYQQASTQTYQAVSPAVRRTGAVTEDAGPSDQAPGARAAIDQRLRRRFQVGFDTLAFLPTKIRKGVIARLRNVSVFTGQAVRYDNGDRFEVQLLGLYDTGAVVVAATTHRDTISWQTDQYVYEWQSSRAELGQRGSRRLPPS